MTVNENASGSAGNPQNVLQTITGIGPKVAEALSQIGIHGLEGLAESTPEELAKVLVSLRISVKRIEAENWIGQARQKLAERETDTTSSPQDVTPAMTKAQAPENQVDDWNLQAEFALYFENKATGQGEDTWQTRVWKTRVRDRECDKEITFAGLEPHPWVNWILRQADLPVDAQPYLLASETPVAPAAATPSPAQVSILDVEVEPQSPPGVRKKTLMTSIQFMISGLKADIPTAQSAPYQILMLIVDRDRRLTKLIAAEHGSLVPDQSVYTQALEYSVPDLGRYELQTLVLIQSEPDLMASYRGPIINVVP